MKFQSPLEPAILIKRYKRFLADVRLTNNNVMTVHCANTGSMMGLANTNQKIWIENSNNPNRKLKFSWKLNELLSNSFVIVDTGMANKIVKEALKDKDKRKANYYCAIVFIKSPNDPQPIIAEGIWHGEILEIPRGKNGFGYDSLFLDYKTDLSAAELSAEIKNKISHRGQALQKLKQKLKIIYDQ